MGTVLRIEVVKCYERKNGIMRNVFTRCFLGVVTLMLVTSGVIADGNLHDTTTGQIGVMSVSSGPESIDNAEDYKFLVYDCGSIDNGSQTTDIVLALEELGLYSDDYTLRRGSSNPVTIQDLQEHDILIVGWNLIGDISGLDPSVIDVGIHGRVILTGHDADYHTATHAGSHDEGDFQPADIFLSQAIEYVLEGEGTGLIALGDPDDGFSWLPSYWGIDTTTINTGEEVTEITTEGIASGVYDRLDPNYLSDWSYSYHNSFDNWGVGFVPFELGEYANVERVITIAANINPYAFEFDKEDDVADEDCVSPEETLTYTITWNNLSDTIYTDVSIVDYLPFEVYYPEGFYQESGDIWNPIPPDPNYFEESHSYVWNIGTIGAWETGSVTLEVVVSEAAMPGMSFMNIAYIYSGQATLGVANEYTNVCCWQTTNPDIIYVDKNANGYNSGISWVHAYTDLKDAVNRATVTECSATGYKIYVAQGEYSPGGDVSDSFDLPIYTEMYGGFITGGSDFEDRNPNKYITILQGKISDTLQNESIVNVENECIIDGFIIQNASDYGIYGSDSDFEIKNCQVLNSGYGVYSIGGDVNVEWSWFKYNTHHGIYHYGATKTLSILNCFSSFNKEHGILAENSSLTLKNSVVTKNGIENDAYCGVKVIDPNDVPVLYNNTISYNYNEGISYVKSDPNAFADVQNCIIYYNNVGGEQMSGIEYPEYCCIYDPVNDPNGLDYIDYGDGNVSGKPMFVYFGDPNNIHLAYNSELIDSGNPSFTNAETGTEDIDNETRIINSWIDIGADEVYSCDDDLSEDDIYNERDWNGDGIVNLHEFAMMSAAWLANSPNNPAYVADPNSFPSSYCDNWDETCNLYVDYKIDISDLTLFTPEWLWTACWKDSYGSRFENVTVPLGGESLMVSMSLSVETISSTELESINETTEEENLAMLVIAIYQLMDIMDEAKYNPSPDFAIENIDEEKAKLEEILWEMYDDYYSIDGKKTKKDKFK